MMNEDNELIEALFPFYALDSLAPEEQAQVEAYVAANPEARQRLDEMMSTAVDIPFDVTPVAPPPQVKQSLMARVQADAAARVPPRAVPKPTPVPRPDQSTGAGRLGWWPRLQASWAMPALAAGALVLALFLGVWTLSLNRQITQLQDSVASLATREAESASNLRALQEELVALQDENELLRRESQRQNEVLALLAAPGTLSIAVSGTEAQPLASGNLVINPETQTAVFLARGLQPLDPNQTYQLWFIHDDQPVSAGLIEVSDDGEAAFVLPPTTAVTDLDAVGVSIEPEGGSLQPTGDIVLLGSASS